MSKVPFSAPMLKGTEQVRPGIVPPPVVHVVGYDVGDPRAAAVVDQHLGKIRQFVNEQRQTYALSLGEIAPQGRRSFPDVDMRYDNVQGTETITILPRVHGEESDVPTGPCRWIIIEHVYRSNFVTMAIPYMRPNGGYDFNYAYLEGNINAERYVEDFWQDPWVNVPARYWAWWTSTRERLAPEIVDYVPGNILTDGGGTWIGYAQTADTTNAPPLGGWAGGSYDSQEPPKGYRADDGHTLFARHELLVGPLKGQFVGSDPTGDQGWDSYRFTPPGYSPNLFVEDYATWPGFFQTYTEYGARTTYTRARYTDDSLDPGDPDDMYARPSVNRFDQNRTVVLDIKKLRGDLKNPQIKLLCSGFWQSLRNTVSSFRNGPDETTGYGEWSNGYDTIPGPPEWSAWSREARTPSSITVETRVTRIWDFYDENGVVEATRLMDYLYPYNEAFDPRYGPTGVKEVTRVVQTVPLSAVMAVHNEPSAPTGGAFGQLFGTLHYNCVTGAYGFQQP